MKTNQEFYTIVNWRTIYSYCPIEIKAYLTHEIDFFKKHLIQKSSTLDVGCGDGRIINDLNDFLEPNHTWGTDISSNSIDYCKENLKKYNFKLEAIEKTNFPKNYFNNIILGFNFLGNIEISLRLKVLDKLSEILTDNGVLLFSVYNYDARRLQECWYSKFGTNIISNKNSTKGNKDGIDFCSYRFSLDELNELFVPNFELKLVENKISYFGVARKK